MLMNTPAKRATTVPTEARNHQSMGERIHAATELLRPLLKPDSAYQGAAYFRALGKLHDNYPELNQGELEALATSVMRALHKH
jgi:hypothetical protein